MTIPSRADADLDLAVKGIVASRICFSGQVCNCCERVYVHESVKDAFIGKLTAAMEAVRVGAPGEDVDICGLVSSMQFDKVKGMVDRAVAGGAAVPQILARRLQTKYKWDEGGGVLGLEIHSVYDPQATGFGDLNGASPVLVVKSRLALTRAT